MRIIAGEMKGFKLKAPKGIETRPTSDRVKESLFNIIGYVESSSRVLDLFSGSGNIGLEFLSRGAEEVYFIDNDPDSIKTIKENSKKCKVENRSHIFKNDVFKAIEVLNRKRVKFDYIFLDPPYNRGIGEKVIEKISNLDILKCDGLIIVEHEKDSKLKENFKIKVIDNRLYGTTELTFLKRQSRE